MPTFKPPDTTEEDLKRNPVWYSPDGVAWCTFTSGSLECVNGQYCKNPNHKVWQESARDEAANV